MPWSNPLAKETPSKTPITSYFPTNTQTPLPQPHIPVQADIDKSFLFDTTPQTTPQCISNHSIFSPREESSLPHPIEPQFWDKFQTSNSLDGLDVLASARPDFIDTDSLSSMVACTPDFDSKFLLVSNSNTTTTASMTTPPLLCDPSCLTPESQLTATPLVPAGSVQSVDSALPRVPDNTPVDALALGNVPNFSLDSLDSDFLNNLLHSSLVNSAIEDSNNWEPLFPDSNQAAVTTSAISPPSRPLSTVMENVADSITTPLSTEKPLSISHPLFETKFVHEKRSALVLAGKEKKEDIEDDDGEDEEDLERLKKKRLISSLEFEELSLNSASTPSKDLPPIVVDPSDRRAVKRARNTMAARRSREKKKMEMDELRQKVSDQERVIMKLEAQVNLLRTLLEQK